MDPSTGAGGGLLMGMLGVAGAVVAGVAVGLAATTAWAGGAVPDDPAAFGRTRSLGDVIAASDAADRPVHILYVHGMRAEGPDFSKAFRQAICEHVAGACITAPREPPPFRVDLGPRPDLRVAGRPVWDSDAAWTASAPFVDRYVFERTGRPPIVVDEVNWWPLLFPLKCRFIVAPEGRLSGPDRRRLELCVERGDPAHPWLTPAEMAESLKGPRLRGGGAYLNRLGKREIMNFGLADATITLGPLRDYLREAMDQAFGYAARFDGGATGQEFVVISESLGSFMVLDAARGGGAAKAVIDQTANYYFFANQFRLLELARVEDPSSLKAGEAADASPLGVLMAPVADKAGLAVPPTRQVIAFSDPSDLLTFDMPRLIRPDGSEAAVVVNVHTRNATSWLGLFADPLKAHTGGQREQARAEDDVRGGGALGAQPDRLHGRTISRAPGMSCRSVEGTRGRVPAGLRTTCPTEP
ncbi:hypothetical protein [Phenylobacterium sp. J367]|uniref:hypothetical protein n=1 Tax=Phenylobacterium sp. J367 TaxID=2898435 RepID=UPI002151BE05|nr:hypothetical protein [Phenylobacterium sp. J367]MCR5877405.1 hypothetical protein [Phenylobacterium sp. J367]